MKPEFFRHELLQELENQHPGNRVMLTFAGLWTLADKDGRFEWKPKIIKLDVLPFIEFDMEETLSILEKAGFLFSYSIDNKKYGQIDSFNKHQRITGKEYESGSRFPSPGKHKGNNRETPGCPGREGKGKGKGKGKDIAAAASPGVVLSSWNAFAEKAGLQKITGVMKGSKREAHLKARLADPAFSFPALIEIIGRSRFLCGLSKPKDGEQPFRATFDWIICPSNYQKIMEGNYLDGPKPVRLGENIRVDHDGRASLKRSADYRAQLVAEGKWTDEQIAERVATFVNEGRA